MPDFDPKTGCGVGRHVIMGGLMAQLARLGSSSVRYCPLVSQVRGSRLDEVTGNRGSVRYVSCHVHQKRLRMHWNVYRHSAHTKLKSSRLIYARTLQFIQIVLFFAPLASYLTNSAIPKGTL